MLDLDASIVFAASDKDNAVPTYKGGIGFAPNLATCDNTDDLLVIDPRAGNATANCAADNITLLDQAVARLPGRFRHRLLVRLDGAGFSHELLDHIAAAGGRRGAPLGVLGRLVVHRHRTRRHRPTPPTGVGTRDRPATVNSCPIRWSPTFVAELTGLLNLTRWPAGTRIVVRDEPLHPRYRKRATDRRSSWDAATS